MPAETNAREIPKISAVTLRFFQRITRAYFRRHFRSVMVQHEEYMAGAQGPLIIFANHSSWWDPMVSILLAQMLLPERRHYAPMDASALMRYSILRRIGLFPVDMSSARGAVQFLRTSEAVLSSGGVVWITPQGHFADPRASPLAFKPGLGALAARANHVTLVPLAIEYTFWNERLPETLLRFGEPIQIEHNTDLKVATQQLEGSLEKAMQELKMSAMNRDASAFRVLLSGSRGTGGAYGIARRLRALITREPLALDHTKRPETPSVRHKP